MLSKSRYTATRGVPGSVTVQSYHLTVRLRTDRNSLGESAISPQRRQTRLTHTRWLVLGSRRHGRPAVLEWRIGVVVNMTVTDVGAEAWIYLGNTLVDLKPGESVDTAVVFDLPKGTGVESIELGDGPFSDGATVGR
jgi:hypothetical protein